MQEFLTNPVGRDLEEIVKEFSPTRAAIEKNFLEKRHVYLWGAVEDSSARYIVERLLYLESVDPGKDITLFINSPGGVITSGMCIYDTMNMISSDVSTVCMGLAASMGALLLCGGTKGKRYAWPHSRIMIHQPLISGQIVAPAVDIKIHAQEIKKTRDELNRIIAEASGRSIEQVERDTDRDNYMNTKEAIEYGLIDAAFPGY
ncbi:MAG: ATP-dependent Clp protease proteolytic subunit [Leptonema illini]|jgi:ATP-dependent Clp protease protease subunit|uniref:ATP-dependent Clp protease proteolytic subunit n=2 Tax=Leptonema illini TaxID=183 RepID=H2CCC3_9LEPT|nr:ATP-dependent Clp protease proteolytic subunit [Leptonema illini]EHQ06380.1 ATP-dependent Clp protease proteolytic subunit ClpP [Leptonema illini DSM 21528]KAB2934698.1 MAG: ATP-dependent Clp protease proteolytic subunit [Leptonema illini]PKL32949.1 MAG: ATP-dependent Clp protease proteolytic subunit [Spirochaetae bacterium HGW-Spirochaetae-10]